MRSVNKHLYEFGSFQLDTGDGMLLRQGQYIPITPKALETLVLLVEHSGRIVDKEEFLRQVWPDTFVEDVTLAKNVSTLRKILGDCAAQRYIETIPKRGYRFVAEVRLLEDPPAEPLRRSAATMVIDAQPAPPPVLPAVAPTVAAMPRPRRWPWLAAAVVAGLGAWTFTRDSTPPPPSSLKNVPLTSFSGRQTQVAFSPDGKQIAFVWDGPQSDGSHVYVKRIDGESLLQLTRGTEADSKPAWSPDGRQISFLRASGISRAWYLVPSQGGNERKLTEVSREFEPGHANSPYFSRDGQSLAIVDRPSPTEPAALYALSLSTTQRRQLTNPPSGTAGDGYPAFSPDGQQLAFTRASSFSGVDLYVSSLATSQVRRLTYDGLPIEGLAWTSNGGEIVFSSRRGGSIHSLWRIPPTGGTPLPVSPTAAELTSPAIAPSGNRLAYTRAFDDINIWQISLDTAGRATAKTPLIASTFRDSDPEYSPDGSRIAFVSGRAGSFGIWVCQRDGSNPRLLFDGGAYVSGSPRWSPDGRWIAFDSRSVDPASKGSPFIGLVGADGRNFRTLTSIGKGGFAPSWSRDGRSIYFGSMRGGRLNIWKVPLDGGDEVQVTRNGGFEGFESQDGHSLFYLKRRGVPGIWRVAVEGGEESLVPGTESVGLWRSWRVQGKGIYFTTALPSAGGSKIDFLDLATGRIREIARMEHSPDPIIPSLAVSTDLSRILYAQFDQRGSNIMMVEGFR